MQQSSLIHVLVSDGLVLHREALASLITTRAAMHAVMSGNTPLEIAAACCPDVPDVVLLGIDRLNIGELDTLRSISARGMAVVVLTATNDPSAHARAIESGARGIVWRGQSGEVVCEAIRAVHRGEIWIERQGAPAVMNCVLRRQGTRDLESLRVDSLTRREREVLALITEGLRNRQIADRLFISEATVRNHVTSILGKLELTDRFDLAVYAFRRGMATPSFSDADDTSAHPHALVRSAARRA